MLLTNATLRSATVSTLRAPLARPVVSVATLLAWAVVVVGWRHGHGQAEGQVLAHVPDVVHGAARHPDDLVLGGLEHGAAGQLPLERTRENNPPLVELTVPVRAIAPAGWACDESDELPLVGDDPLGPRRRPHRGHEIGHARVEPVGPRVAGCRGRTRAIRERADDDRDRGVPGSHVRVGQLRNDGSIRSRRRSSPGHTSPPRPPPGRCALCRRAYESSSTSFGTGISSPPPAGARTGSARVGSGLSPC